MSVSPVQLIQSEHQEHFAYAAVANDASRLIHTAGAMPIDVNNETVSIGDIQGQTEKAMDNLEAYLKAAGATLHDVVKVMVYVVTTNNRDLGAVWNVVRRRFEHDPPGTVVGVATLACDGQLVEVEAVAAT